MKCDIEMLNMYIDGMLTELETKEVEVHLSACKICKEEYESLISMFSLFPNYQETVVPEGFNTAVMEKIESYQTKQYISIWVPISSLIILLYLAVNLVMGIKAVDFTATVNLATETLTNTIIGLYTTTVIVGRILSSLLVTIKSILLIYEQLWFLILALGAITVFLQFILIKTLNNKSRQIA